MSQRRTLILIAAIAIGALASFLVWNYVGGIQDQAYKDSEQVKVFLVKQPVSKGTSGNVAMASIVQENIPRKFKPANAIVSLDDISGKVARTDLVANQVLVQDMFVDASDPEAQRTFAENLEKIRNKDMTTFTVNLDDTRGVAGLIVPGDYVNVMITPTTGDDSGTTNTTRAVYQKVQVLAVDYLTVGDANAANGAPPAEGEAPAVTADVRKGMVTLIVPPEAVQVLSSLPTERLYFTLVGADYQPTQLLPPDLATLPGENPDELTPYGPDGARNKDKD